MLLLGYQSRLRVTYRMSRPSAPLRKAVFSADVRTDHISNLQALLVSKHEAAVRCEQRVYVQGGPSASGKKYVDIKFKVPLLAHRINLQLKVTSTLVSTYFVLEADGPPCTYLNQHQPEDVTWQILCHSSFQLTNLSSCLAALSTVVVKQPASAASVPRENRS